MLSVHQRGWRPGPLLTGMLGGAAAVGLLTFGSRIFLAHQANSARRVIGKPFGEEALVSDRVYKKKYGRPVDLLILGDSIAAGLGAESPDATLGGELARRLARATKRSVRLRTAAVVGAETPMMQTQLDSLPDDYRPEVAVVVVGGNDVIHRVRIADSRTHLAATIDQLRDLGTEVVVGTCPDLAALRTVPQPLRSLVGVLSRQLAAAQREVALSHGARAVSLAQVAGPFFAARPDEMFSVDRFHPSGAGYRRTAKALLPSVLAALGEADSVPFGHHEPPPRAEADNRLTSSTQGAVAQSVRASDS